MTEYVIRYQGLAGTAVLAGNVPLNSYLEHYDPEAHEGRGSAKWTADIDHALLFPTMEAAMEFWRKQSRTRPLRPDGKPNRPLTAFNVTVEPAPPSPGIPPIPI